MIVIVGKDHGAGSEPSGAPDRVVEYRGKRVEVRF
jgi:hypothetical protein